MSFLPESLLKNTVVHVAFAFVAMGAWGVYANLAHTFPKPFLAGFVQGLMSGILTLFLKGTVDAMRPRFPQRAGYWAPPLIASLGSASLLVGAHWLAGTPEILTTIAVPLTVSVTYIFTYNFIRQRKARED